MASASQQVLFSETIAAMKKAMKRKAYDSDSDSEIETGHNRGRKLKKSGRFAHQGQLVPSSKPSAYKEGVEYAGVRRSIIYRNPPLVDDEGYEVDSEIDDEDRIEAAAEAAAELNPYSNIRIEEILAPLTASTDLSVHPTLSKSFTSETLTDLCVQSDKIMRKENQSLWQVRHLWTALCGDAVWLPCETMIRPNDAQLYTSDHVAQHLLALSKGEQPQEGAEGSKVTRNGSDKASGEENEAGDDNAAKDSDQTVADTTMTDADANKASEKKADGLNPKQKTNDSDEKIPKSEDTESEHNQQQVDKQLESGATQSMVNHQQTNGESIPNHNKHDYVHPMFLPPEGATPDRNLGLPQAEAEDIRRLLALYVQKQEEICRGTKRLHHGLLKAEHLRKEVLHWSKAEAHSGVNRDMSDGEDWYDKEEWGLTEDLKKGQDEEEEDTTTTGKKTRARRG